MNKIVTFAAAKGAYLKRHRLSTWPRSGRIRMFRPERCCGSAGLRNQVGVGGPGIWRSPALFGPGCKTTGYRASSLRWFQRPDYHRHSACWSDNRSRCQSGRFRSSAVHRHRTGSATGMKHSQRASEQHSGSCPGVQSRAAHSGIQNGNGSSRGSTHTTFRCSHPQTAGYQSLHGNST